MNEEERKSTNDFFNVYRLQKTFTILEDAKGVDFFQNLLKYRILFDYFVIRIFENDAGSLSYFLEMNDDKSEKLIKYQSMLYVSTTFHIWLTPLFTALVTNQKNAEELLTLLKTIDNDRRKDTTKISLTYGSVDRYWFWRLDYYLWEREFLKSEHNDNKIIGYTFKSNRSIEHLHPQTTDDVWNDADLHSFGNLAMISSSFNSMQSNDDRAVKFARIVKQKEDNKLESIKMLKMYEESNNGVEWTPKIAKKHGNEMITVLIDSFGDDDSYNEIREKLKKIKLE